MRAVLAVSNQEFIDSVFHRCDEDAFIWATSFNGDPANMPNSSWNGRKGVDGKLPPLIEAGNTYFNLSSLKEHDGRVERKGVNFNALHVVVLDDVGTKAQLPAGFEPSYMLETSPGNYQVGMILDAPLRDVEVARALFAALANKGFTDQGTQGPQSRYCRLPVGVNLKTTYGPTGFNHRLASWNPERHFSIDSILLAFGLELNVKATVPSRPAVRRPLDEVEEVADTLVLGQVFRSAKMRAIWEGQEAGFGSGSDADQALLNFLAFRCPDADQVERLYSQAPRADRKSSDGTCKWRTRADYRQRSLEAAFKFVDAHPCADADEAQAVVEAALATAKASGDFRVLYAPDAVEAMATLKRAAPGQYDYVRKQAKKAGATLTMLDAEIQKSSDDERLCDADAADLALERLGGEGSLLWARGEWWLWRGEQGLWVRIEDDETIRRSIHDVLPKHQISAASVGSILAVLRTKVSTDQAFDKPASPWVVNCQNGELHLKAVDFDTGLAEGFWELKPHRRESYLTSQVGISFDPSAPCPTFEAFLGSIVEGDSDALDKRNLIMEAIGYSMFPTSRLERFVILHGPASNGKSTLLSVLEMLAGKGNASALSLNQLGERFALANLQGKLVNLCAEIPRGAPLPDEAIKRLSSGDVVTAERKGSNHFEFRPHATLWFACNELPRLKDLSFATLEKRCLLVSLNQVFEGERRDTSLGDRLAKELPGSFALCVWWFAGIKAIDQEVTGYRITGAGELEPIRQRDQLLQCPPSGVDAKAAWRLDSDPVANFANERLEAGVVSFVASSDLFAAWAAWAEGNGVKLALDARQLSNRLKSHFGDLIETGQAARQNGQRGVRGLRITKDIGPS